MPMQIKTLRIEHLHRKTLSSLTPFFLLLTLIVQPALLLAENESATEENAAKLESLKMKLSETQKDMAHAVSEQSLLQNELKQTEIEAGKVAGKLKQIQGKLVLQQDKLAQLQQQQQQQQAYLTAQKDSLSRQIRSAYMTGRSDYIKLLLNQEDPATAGRVMAYYDYHNRARSEKIMTAMAQLETLYELQQSIQEESQLLSELKQTEDVRLEEFTRSREMRESILLKLERYISDKGSELETITTQVEALEKLLSNLGSQQSSSIRFFEDIPPFRNNRGKMPWPIEGEILHHFGTTKKNNGLKWDGVLIKANQGSDVKAISNGKVVYSDWFRNLGLLVILEHGDGYMSLYGHNEALLKNQGDWVLTGETIATVGDSGGQIQPGLYFEIRKKGIPVNPVKWCRK